MRLLQCTSAICTYFGAYIFICTYFGAYSIVMSLVSSGHTHISVHIFLYAPGKVHIFICTFLGAYSHVTSLVSSAHA